MVRDRFQILDKGIKTTGTVIALSHSENTVAPIFGFKDEWGNELSYNSKFYTNVNPYKVGDKATLYYLLDHPEKVAMDGVGWEAWFPFLFLFTHGGVGFGGLYWLEKKRRLHNWLQQNGQQIQARFTEVQKTYNKRQYFTLKAVWTDPLSNTEYTFESDAFSQDPSSAIALGENIRVLIDPENPKRYWMDTGFLDGY